MLTLQTVIMSTSPHYADMINLHINRLNYEVIVRHFCKIAMLQKTNYASFYHRLRKFLVYIPDHYNSFYCK